MDASASIKDEKSIILKRENNFWKPNNNNNNNLQEAAIADGISLPLGPMRAFISFY